MTTILQCKDCGEFDMRVKNVRMHARKDYTLWRVYRCVYCGAEWYGEFTVKHRHRPTQTKFAFARRQYIA